MLKHICWIIGIRATQGKGKTDVNSKVAYLKYKETGFNFHLVALEDKEETTLPFYRNAFGSEWKESMWWKGFTIPMVRRLGNEGNLLWFEDYPLLCRSEARRRVIESVITALSRQNNLICSYTTQNKTLPSDLTILLKLMSGRNMYRISDDNGNTGWQDWTDNQNELAKLIFECSKNGVIQTVLNSGRKFVSNSLHHECFLRFAEGVKPIQIILEKGFKSQTKEYRSVFIYHREWVLAGSPMGANLNKT